MVTAPVTGLTVIGTYLRLSVLSVEYDASEVEWRIIAHALAVKRDCSAKISEGEPSYTVSWNE